MGWAPNALPATHTATASGQPAAWLASVGGDMPGPSVLRWPPHFSLRGVPLSSPTAARPHHLREGQASGWKSPTDSSTLVAAWQAGGLPVCPSGHVPFLASEDTAYSAARNRGTIYCSRYNPIHCNYFKKCKRIGRLESITQASSLRLGLNQLGEEKREMTLCR